MFNTIENMAHNVQESQIQLISNYNN